MKQLEHHHRGNAEQDALSGGLTLDLPGKAALQVVWRRKWLVLAVAGACLGVSVLRVLFATRVYCAESQLYIEEAAPLLGQNASGKSPAGNLHTQAEVIQSTPVLAIALANFRAPGAHEPLTLAAADNAIGTLKQGLDAGVGKDDDIITVSFECADKDDAEAILKGVVDAYQTFVARRHKSSAVDALVNLRREKQERERELAEKTRALNDFRRAEGTLALDGDRDALVMKQVTAMSDALTAAQLDALSAKSAFDEAAGAISDNVGAVVRKINNARAAGTLSAVSDTAMLQSELNQLQQSMKSVRQHYLPDHPMVRRLQGRLEQLNLTYVAALHNRWQAAARRHEEIGAALTTLQGRAVESNSKAAEYARLEAEMRRAERMLDVLDTRMKELNVTGDAPGFSVQVLEEAHALFAPVYPRKSVMLFQGLVLGLMLGAGLTFLDRRFRSSDEVKSTLNLPVLGVVPHMPGRHSPALRARRVHVESSSEVAEAYRAVRTALFFGLRHDEAKTVLVASATPGEGKTTLTSNLAIALAQAGQRVLLLDADFRRPMQQRVFEVRDHVGLSTVLGGRAGADEAIQASAIAGLDVMPAGPTPPNPSEILNGGAFTDLLENVASRYDYILVDSPPAAAVTDARILAAMCDVTVMVVRAERSNRKSVVQARDALRSVGANLLGVVINDAPRHNSRYDQGGAYEQYQRAYEQEEPARGASDTDLHAKFVKPLTLTVKQTGST